MLLQMLLVQIRYITQSTSLQVSENLFENSDRTPKIPTTSKLLSKRKNPEMFPRVIIWFPPLVPVNRQNQVQKLDIQPLLRITVITALMLTNKMKNENIVRKTTSVKRIFSKFPRDSLKTDDVLIKNHSPVELDNLIGKFLLTVHKAEKITNRTH